MSASIDDNITGEPREYAENEVTADLVAALVKLLDGGRRTLVTLGSAGGGRLEIGGSSATGMVVSMTEAGAEAQDEPATRRLRAGRAGRAETDRTRPGPAPVVIGGRPVEVGGHHVVDLDEALAVALSYAESGEPGAELQWDPLEPGRV